MILLNYLIFLFTRKTQHHISEIELPVVLDLRLLELPPDRLVFAGNSHIWF